MTVGRRARQSRRRQAGGCAYGYACVYTDTVSWASPTEPLPMIRDPRVAFDQLFGAGGTSEERAQRRRTERSILDWVLRDLNTLNRERLSQVGDPEIATRIAQYELAFRMQSSVPELLDVSKEPKHVLESYGPDVHRPGSYAANCLLARRMAERDVRCGHGDRAHGT